MSIRTLVVDDNSFFLNSVISFLSKKPDVTIIGSSTKEDEALRLAKAHKPDLILLDIFMPSVDGFDLLQEFRGQGIDSCILMMTIYDVKEYAQKAHDLGANGILFKPNLNNEFTRAIELYNNDKNEFYISSYYKTHKV